MAEQWRDVAGNVGIYQVSDQGQVWNAHTTKILQPITMKNGRFYVTLSSDGFSRKCTVHRLVAAAFLGDCPREHEITPGDGDYTYARGTADILLRQEPGEEDEDEEDDDKKNEDDDEHDDDDDETDGGYSE